MKVILCSSSRRRQNILGLIFPDPELLIPNIDETPAENEPPEAFACRMAEEKLNAVTGELLRREEALLAVAADTIVSLNGRIIGKPSSYEEAVEILSALSGKTHQVITGMTLLAREADGEVKRLSDFAKSRVTFGILTQETIREYLSVTDWHDKAGAYSVLENGGMLIARTEGSVSNIAGFPVSLFLRMAAGVSRTLFKAQ